MIGLQTAHSNVGSSVKDFCEQVVNDLKITHETWQVHIVQKLKDSM